MLTKLRRILARLLLYCSDPLTLSSYHLSLFVQCLFGDALRQVDRLLPHRDKGLRHLARQCRQAGFAIQTLSQARPPLIEQPPTRAGLPRPSSRRTRSTVGRSPPANTASAAANTSFSCTPTAMAHPGYIRSDNRMLSDVISED